MKSLLLVLVLLFLSVDSSPIWKVFCSGGPLFRGRIDPIVNPGKVAGHSHKVAGGNHFSAATATSTPISVYNDLYSSSCTTCSIGQVDLSAYWHPDLYYMWPNGSFSLVPNGGLTVYYLSRTGSGDQANPNFQAIPRGLRMLAGNPYRRSFNGSVAEQAINYVCLTAAGAPSPPNEPNNFPTDQYFCANGLRAQVFFPMCWNGVDLDSADHKSHMAYPTSPDGGNCPPDHPVRIPGVFFEAFYSVSSFPHGQGTNPFVWSCGDPTGYGFHGDFVSGWDPEVMQAAINNTACDNSNPAMAFGNNVLACPPLAPYVQNVPGPGDCSLASPIPLTEDLGIGHTIPALPGCNPITYGPEDAIPCTSLAGQTPSLGTDKRFLLLSVLTGTYVTAPNNQSAPIQAGSSGKTLNDIFDPIPIAGNQVALLSENSGQYVSASGDNTRLVANRGTASLWEMYIIQPQPQGNGTVAIISARNNLYVTVGSDLTLIPNALNVTSNAQLFQLITPGGGSIGSPSFNTAVPSRTLNTVNLPGSTSTKNGYSSSAERNYAAGILVSLALVFLP